MNKLIILFIVITVVASYPADDWKSWKTNYGKKYNDDAEEGMRKKIFDMNMKEINSHNAAYERGEVSFRKMANHFADLTDDEVISKYTGLKMPDDEK